MQPFGGHGLSGTGPKAGGPLYLKRLVARAPAAWPPLPAGAPDAAAKAFAGFVAKRGDAELAALCERIVAESRLGVSLELPGPVGERNVYSLEPRGAVLCDAADEADADRPDRLRAGDRQPRAAQRRVGGRRSSPRCRSRCANASRSTRRPTASTRR